MLEAAERKMLYGFLSVLFRQPDEETMVILRGVKEATFASVFPGLPVPPVPSLPELQHSFEQLFVPRNGAAPAPPYGSAYLEKAGSAGASTRMVGILYASAGLDTERSPEPPDYLPTELEFLFYLTEGEQQSREQDTGTPPSRWVASQADFFHNFFVPWIGSFCDRVTAAGEALPLYVWAAELLRRFTAMEKERLKVL